MLRFNTERPRKTTSGLKSPLKQKMSELSSPSKVFAAMEKKSSEVNGNAEGNDDSMAKCGGDEGDEGEGDEAKGGRPKTIQTRPLPALPESNKYVGSTWFLQTRTLGTSCIVKTVYCTYKFRFRSGSPFDKAPTPSEKESEIVLKSDGDGGAYSSLLVSPDHYTELQSIPPPVLPSSSTLLLSKGSKRNSSASNYLTMTGTIKRGPNAKRKRTPLSTRSLSAASGAEEQEQEQEQEQQQQQQQQQQPSADLMEQVDDPVYDVRMNLTAEGLRAIEKRVHDKYHDRCFCGLRRGPHVFVLSLLFLPFMLVYSTLSAFYSGTLTWYSIFVTVNEERGCMGRLASPFVLLAYPLWIAPVTLGLGLYGAAAQVSWYLDSWLSAVSAPDGGFFGWFCNWIGDPESAPYQVILLTVRDYEKPALLQDQGQGATQL